jgi:1-acyl-sn-glycerol-3-phosphate acyltransferase
MTLSDRPAKTHSAVACWRLLRCAHHLLLGLFVIRFRFPGFSPEHRKQRVIQWSSEFVTLLGLQMTVRGQFPAKGPLLLVANHISWLDISVLHASGYCRFVSKADVQHWPVLGGLASGINTLYIARESRRDAMRVVHHIKEALLEGDIVSIFPEGTTSDGTGVLPFYGNLIQAAISANVPVLPVALRYEFCADGQLSTDTSYVGEQTLFNSLWRTVCAPPVRAVVCIGEPQEANGRDRRVWATDLREAVRVLAA